MIIVEKPANIWLYIGLALGLSGLIYALVKDEINDDAVVESLNEKVAELHEQLNNVPVIFDDENDETETEKPDPEKESE